MLAGAGPVPLSSARLPEQPTAPGTNECIRREVTALKNIFITLINGALKVELMYIKGRSGMFLQQSISEVCWSSKCYVNGVYRLNINTAAMPHDWTLN